MINITLENITAHQLSEIGRVLEGFSTSEIVTTTIVEKVGDVSRTDTTENVSINVPSEMDLTMANGATITALAGDAQTAAELFGGDAGNAAPVAPVVDTNLAAPITDTANTAPPVELDARLMPWDARIHGSTKTKNKDDTWKYKKGVDKVTMVPQVEAEIVQAAPVAPLEPAAGTASPSMFAATDTPVAAVSSTEVRPTTFLQLLPLVMAKKKTGTLTQETLDQVAALHGASNFGLLNTIATPELIAAVASQLGV